MFFKKYSYYLGNTIKDNTPIFCCLPIKRRHFSLEFIRNKHFKFTNCKFVNVCWFVNFYYYFFYCCCFIFGMNDHFFFHFRHFCTMSLLLLHVALILSDFNCKL